MGFIGHLVNTTIIQMYATTSASDEENGERFDEKLQEMVEQVSEDV